MQEKPPIRMLQEDEAPVDYNYVPSVSEGRRREQAQKIHRDMRPAGPIVRHRAEPEGAANAISRPSREPRSTATQRDTIMRRLPSMQDGPAPAQRVALPQDYGIPDNPFQPPEETQRPGQRRRRAARYAQPSGNTERKISESSMQNVKQTAGSASGSCMRSTVL